MKLIIWLKYVYMKEGAMLILNLREVNEVTKCWYSTLLKEIILYENIVTYVIIVKNNWLNYIRILMQ